MHRSVWLVTPEVTYAGDDYLGGTPTEALASVGALLARVGGALHRTGQTDGLVLVDAPTADHLGLTEPATDDGRRQRALDAAAGAGWQSTKIGTFTAFYAKGRPTVHIAQYQ